MSGWRYSFHDQIRYGDLDTNAHLNNVAVHGFFESARVAYMRGCSRTSSRWGARERSG